MTDPFDKLRGRARPDAAPAPTGAVEEAVSAGRRRRMRALVGGGAGTAVLVGLLVVALTGGSEAPQTLDVIDGPSPTAEASEEPSVDGSGSASAVPLPSASPSPVTSESGGHGDGPSPAPSPSASDDGTDWTRSFNDGKPGWGGGYTGCETSDESPEQPAIGRTVTVETLLPRTGWRPGEPIQAYVVITNNGTTRREESLYGDGTHGVVWDSSGKPVSAAHWTDAIQVRTVALDPGESKRVLVSANTVICGDGPDDPEPPLPAGAYTVTFNMGDRLGRTAPVRVTLDPQASTRSVWQMQPRDVPRPTGRPCDSIPLDDTELSGFTMSMEPESYTVEAGGRLDAVIIVTATRATTFVTDPRANPTYSRGDSPATSAGVDAGPFTEPSDAGERAMARDDVPALRVGDSLRYPMSWVAESCPDGGTGPGIALPPGDYPVHFGLLVVLDSGARKYWLSDYTASITVT